MLSTTGVWAIKATRRTHEYLWQHHVGHHWFREITRHGRHSRIVRGGGRIGGGAGRRAPMSQVDVEAVLTGLAAKNKEKLDWRKSIVGGLMKLLKARFKLRPARKELAKEARTIPATPATARR